MFPLLIYQTKFFLQALEHVCSVRYAYIYAHFSSSPFIIILILFRYHQILLFDFRIFFQRLSMFFSVIYFHYALEHLFALFTLETLFFFIVHQIYWYGSEQFKFSSLLLIFLLFNWCARWLSGRQVFLFEYKRWIFNSIEFWNKKF